jgi:hypothetical protein
MGLGSGIRDPGSGKKPKNRIPDPGPGSKRHRIPDPQHCLGRRGVGAAGHRPATRPLVVVQHQLLVVRERLSAHTRKN